jgi:hypothetical protein
MAPELALLSGYNKSEISDDAFDAKSISGNIDDFDSWIHIQMNNRTTNQIREKDDPAINAQNEIDEMTIYINTQGRKYLIMTGKAGSYVSIVDGGTVPLDESVVEYENRDRH